LQRNPLPFIFELFQKFRILPRVRLVETDVVVSRVLFPSEYP
jgi:hypothetical protein